MAAHSSVLARRIPGTGKPGGLPSTGSHRVGHNWSDLAAAAVAAVFLTGQQFPILMKCNLPTSFMNCVFGIKSKHSLLYPRSQKFSSFCSQSFMVFYFTFILMMDLELIFFFFARYKALGQGSFFGIWCPVIPVSLIISVIFNNWLCWKSVGHICRSVSGLYPVLLI